MPFSQRNPIRAELFSLERLETHAESLAAAQPLASEKSRGRKLLPRVKENARVLRQGYKSISKAVREEHAITPAAEWLIDNFYIVEEQIREIIDDLPPGYYRALPKLASGPLEGYPRILGIAWAFIAHTDSRLDPDWLRRFVRAYQRKDVLRIGELWALAISLRIIFIENLRRLTDLIMTSKDAREKADALADDLLGVKGKEPVPPSEALQPWAEIPLERPFAVQLLQRLRDQGGRSSTALQWLDQRLASQGTNAEKIVQEEHQELAALNTTIRNIITSMRHLITLDWSQFFEDVSVVDEMLRTGSRFTQMDFPTRDLYRHAIEELAHGSHLEEIEVTRRALQTAKNASADSALETERLQDPGYYLIGKGRFDFEKTLRFRITLKHLLLRAYVAKATDTYLGSIAFATAVFLALPVHASYRSGTPLSTIIALAILAIIPASDMAVAVVNRMVTDSLGPKTVPKLDFSAGVPETLQSMVVIPTLLSDDFGIQQDLEQLEIHYLSNPSGHLQFALLTDWKDFSEEHAPDDDVLIKTARDGIERLNGLYPAPELENGVRFFLFHRRRLWNEKEGVWMGWERKRGKLEEFNRLLRGDTKTSFITTAKTPSHCHYVITLDADTRMTHGTAYKLVGAMAHPLNRPSLDSQTHRVTQGYGIMQPRITPALPPFGFASLYQKIYSGPAGIDPYAFAVSDVYQDLFKEGSYVGKGIYDIDTFQASLSGRVPENQMLSHDLFEGLYARVALVTDIELFEEFPSHYEVAVARAHRWTRGDWQLLPWILKHLELPLIDHWKMIDNLRRSLSAPTVFLSLVTAWALKSAPAQLWTTFIFTSIALPPLLPVILEIFPRQRQTTLKIHFLGLWEDFELAFSHIVLSIVFMAHQTWVMTDAILRTLYRSLISHKRFLEWQSAALTRNFFDYNVAAFYRRMASVVALSAATTAVLYVLVPSRLPGLPAFLILLWILSPWIAQRLSLSAPPADQKPFAIQDQQYFRWIARKTWNFFETFVTQESHWLPPDNFQEIPKPTIATRTSPTNIGLYLLSVAAARDFGWLGLTETIERLEATARTLSEMKRHQGHFFNWYDTKDFRALDPLYVSTVDSGNLAGHLWTLGNTCRTWQESPLWSENLITGLEDTLQGLENAAAQLPADKRMEAVSVSQLQEALEDFRAALQKIKPPMKDWLTTLSTLREKASVIVDMVRTVASPGDLTEWAERLSRQLAEFSRDAALGDALTPALARRLAALSRKCHEWVQEMNFGFLFDNTKKIFSIGFQVSENKLDTSFYDLLASESRLSSYVAIAKGDVPSTHWFHLSRLLSPIYKDAVLLSWSGSMFEYLMPSLVMQAPVGSLLDQTCRGAVRRQIDYGREREVPWGISESGYNAQDVEFTYQYNSFGVPSLGLKRGLAEELVVAPYATGLAAMVNPTAAAENFRRLSKEGGEGRYGFYEALDYTPTRLSENETVVVVRQYMAHHQGMTLVSLNNVLHQGIMRNRFHFEPMVQAASLLLQERTPRSVPMIPARPEESQGQVRSIVPLVLRRFFSPHDVLPRTHLLSNGRYSVMMTSAGSGYSRCNNIGITRWKEDTTRDAYGTYIFLRDVELEVWSAGYQPTGIEPDRYGVDFSEDRAEIIRWDGSIITTLEVVVSAEDDAEIRRVTLKNTGDDAREIEVTSYAEIILTPPAADNAHPAFSNLFVQTEFVSEVSGLICTRRPRTPEEASLWMAHVVVVDGKTVGELEYESDRVRFLGRGRDIRTPICVIDGKPLSNTAGSVLDPIVSLRHRVRIEPGASVRLHFTTLSAPSRKEVMIMADKYHDLAMFERVVTLAWTHARIQFHHLSIEPAEAHLYQDLASRIIYSHAGLRPSADQLERNTRSATGLWPYGISGDLPIVLLRIDSEEDQGIVREILRAHEYWRLKNLAVDLVILNERGLTYAQELQVAIENLVRSNPFLHRPDSEASTGHVFVLRSNNLSEEDRILLQTAARIIILSHHGTLAQQLERLEGSRSVAQSPPAVRQKKRTLPPSRVVDNPGLHFFNGLGGFSEEGREYTVILGPGQWTPAPWINVIANTSFGFQVSDSGSGYTWSMNSRENQLTSWSNDPVSDPSPEMFYIRDEETGDLWTPTALPIREDTPYTIRHGQGWSRFNHVSHDIRLELLQFVPMNDSIKISRLMIRNLSRRKRKLSVTAYIEWVLGNQRAASAPFIITEKESSTGALFARNPWNTEFAERIAFADLSGTHTRWTADRTEFLGRNGTPDHPAALEGTSPLSGHTGAGFDPCAALQKLIKLAPGESKDVVFFLGQAENRQAATKLIQKYRAENLDTVFQNVQTQWENNLEAVQVRTPDRAMDFMLNRWLLYQTLVCRVWARAAFYQACGAYGFRDQLQDVMALTVSRRDLTREQILRAAGRQFEEGDVQHWWHPPTGRGVRTKISDDRLWLPYVVIHYVEVTGDSAILDEPIPFLEGAPVPVGKEDAYYQPGVSSKKVTLFEHCARALDLSLTVGSHGLPLMGSGDWNDGMNRVGIEGRGESVWLGWFLHTTLWEFSKLAETRNEAQRAETWRVHVSALKASLERDGWDGDWYRRAYFDDGSPLGSSTNKECQIDSIAQSWGILSGAADPGRATRAMSAVNDRLIKAHDKIVLLFTPPFNQIKPNPGYIQGYLPGVRENGGQYTHAAVWTLLAYAALGDGDKAGQLFSMLNPISHGSTRADIQRYKVEPYVVAGDIYAEAPHTGRGGWTWYTGSAGWLYRAGIEWILGCRLRGTTIFIDPCIPKSWPSYEISFRYHSARYELKVENPNGVSKGILVAEVDGKPVRGGAAISLVDDGEEHHIKIILGNS